MSAMLLLLPAVLLAPVPKDFDAQLKWKLAKGDVFYVVSEDHTAGTVTVNQGGGGATIEQESDTAIAYKYEVLSADGKQRVVKVTVLNLEAKVAVKGQAAPAVVTDVAGATVTLTLDEQFQVTKTETSAAFKEKLLGKPAGTFGGQTELAMVQNLRQVFAVVPPKGVNNGAKWELKTSLPMGGFGRLNRTAKCTAAELKDGTGHAVIATVAEYAWAAPTEEEKKNEPPAAGGVEVTAADLKAEKCKGTVTFDPKRGRLVSSTEELPMTGTMSMKIGDMALDVTMDLTMTRKLTVSDTPPKGK